MKARNLTILKEHGINVPAFITIKDEEDLNLDFSNSNFFAVRSSYSSEDKGRNSYAGQFETFLNVPRKDVKIAIAKVRESYDNSIEYERAKNIKHNETPQKQDIIVQEMIEADYSGVIFTANPMGILNEVVITIGEGIGNNIVEDKVETTTYYYNKDEKLFYLKENQLNIDLSNKILCELIEISQKIKSIFDKEMDIEFAIKNNKIYILQARPITTINYKKIIILDNSNIVESYPGVSLPATQDFVHNVYRDIFRSCIFRITKNKKLVNNMSNVFENMVTTYNGSIYYQIDNWYEVLNLLPFSKKIIKIWQNMVGVENKLVNKPTIKISKFLKGKILISFLYYLIITPHSMKKLNIYFNKMYPYYQKQIEETNNVEELVKLLQKLENTITGVWDITLINDMYAFIFTYLSGGKDNEKISNIKNIESMKPVNAINELIMLAKTKGIESEIYNTKQEEYIELYGDRCLGELKLETKTYRSNPELLLEYVNSNIEKVFDERKKTNSTIKIINPFVKAAKSGISNREVSRLNRSRLYGLARMILLKIGDILVKNEHIDNKEDIFYLFLREINVKSNYQELIYNRKKEYSEYEDIYHPNRLVFSNKVIKSLSRNIYSNQFKEIDNLKGTSTSIGKVIGQAVVIDKVDKNINTTGKIIITKSTDPGWVFLIEKCLGIIAEQGSILSHTAIISRELKKPAIVNVKDATKILKTGDLIELDAFNGKIKILERGSKVGRI